MLTYYGAPRASSVMLTVLRLLVARPVRLALTRLRLVRQEEAAAAGERIAGLLRPQGPRARQGRRVVQRAPAGAGGRTILAAVGRLRQLRHAPSGGRRFAAGDLDADVGAGSSSSRILTTPPVVADGKVFAKDAESTVSAYNADTGQRIWSVTLKPEKARDADEFGGGLAWYGGKLFVTTGFAAVFCLDPNDGKEIWTSLVSAPIRGAPLVFGDRVFAISIDNKLHAMAAVDGSDLWNFAGLQEVAGYVGGNSPAGSGEFVVAPFTSGELVGLRIDSGRPVWNESLVGPRREARAFGNLADIRGRR
jgi:outer membrane protein assembly factor BamB